LTNVHFAELGNGESLLLEIMNIYIILNLYILQFPGRRKSSPYFVL
jgi:hypothetical protein